MKNKYKWVTKKDLQEFRDILQKHSQEINAWFLRFGIKRSTITQGAFNALFKPGLASMFREGHSTKLDKAIFKKVIIKKATRTRKRK